MIPRLSHAPARLLQAAAALGTAVLLAVAAAGGTYALWSSSGTVPGAVITSGSASLAVTAPATLDRAELYPGEAAAGQFDVQNTGSVPLELRMDALTWSSTGATGAQAAVAGALTISVWPASGQGCAATPPTQAWTGIVGGTPKTLGVVLAQEAVQTLCLSAQLAPEAPSAAQGGAVDLQLTVGGTQQ
ncbi:TasA family protein [Kocuria dechangensis]|nr:TasA family protein [Kocuria dechangensis]